MTSEAGRKSHDLSSRPRAGIHTLAPAVSDATGASALDRRATIDHLAAMSSPPFSAATAPFWVFGYGSLMWDPGFPHVAACAATLTGYHRALCVISRRHRGTAEAPGLVMGLAPGGACTGMAFRVDPADEAAVRAYLWEREVPGYIYRDATVAIELAPPETRSKPDRTAAGDKPARLSRTALTYLPDPAHADFVPDLTDDEIVARVAAATGGRGPNRDYLKQTVDHLRALGIEEPGLERLYARFFG